MSSQVVTYALDDSTTVSFEIEPAPGFRPAGSGQALARIRDAVAPAVEAAKTVLDKAKEICPDEIELTFGIKVSGGADWLIAKSAGEASFEIKLKWTPGDGHGVPQPAEPNRAPLEKAEAARDDPAEEKATDSSP